MGRGKEFRGYFCPEQGLFALNFRGRAEKVIVHMHWLTWLLWRPCGLWIQDISMAPRFEMENHSNTSSLSVHTHSPIQTLLKMILKFHNNKDDLI